MADSHKRTAARTVYPALFHSRGSANDEVNDAMKSASTFDPAAFASLRRLAAAIEHYEDATGRVEANGTPNARAEQEAADKEIDAARAAVDEQIKAIRAATFERQGAALDRAAVEGSPEAMADLKAANKRVGARKQLKRK